MKTLALFLALVGGAFAAEEEPSRFEFRCGQELEKIGVREQQRLELFSEHVRRRLFYPTTMPFDREEKLHGLLRNPSGGLLPLTLGVQGSSLQVRLQERVDAFRAEDRRIEIFILGESTRPTRYNGIVLVGSGDLPVLLAEREFSVEADADAHSSQFRISAGKWQFAPTVRPRERAPIEAMFQELSKAMHAATAGAPNVFRNASWLFYRP